MIGKLSGTELHEFKNYTILAMTYDCYPHLLVATASRLLMFLFYQFVMEKTLVMRKVLESEDNPVFKALEIRPLILDDDIIYRDVIYRFISPANGSPWLFMHQQCN